MKGSSTSDTVTSSAKLPQMPFWHNWQGLALCLLVGLFTALPTLYLIANSFNLSGIGEGFRFGFDNWQELAGDRSVTRAINTSFLMSLRAPLGVIIAFVIAWMLVRIEIPGHKIIEYGLWFAFFLPTLPLTVGWILLLDPNYGLINDLLQKWGVTSKPIFSAYSIASIMWVHLSATIIPINVILLTPAIANMEAAFEEAAIMSGANRWVSLTRITIPLITPAIIITTILGFIKSLEAFEVEQILGTPAKISVFATKIYDFVHWDPPRLGEAMTLSTALLIILLGITIVYRWLSKGDVGHATITGKTNRLRSSTRPKWAWIASTLIFLYMAIGIALPLIILVLGTFTRLFGFFFISNPWTSKHWVSVLNDPHFLNAFSNSFLVAGLTALIGTLTFVLLAWAIVRSRLWGRGLLNLLVWLPWGIPGILLGLSTLILILNLPGLVLIHGTIGALVLVLLIKEMPLGVQMIKTSMMQIAKELEEAGQMAGARFGTILLRIIIPLIAPMIGSVFLLTFVAAFRDISASILLAGPNSRTMAIFMIELGEEGRFEAMAVIGVILSFVVLLMTIAMRMLQSRIGIQR
ncbi:MAG: iron ABC transporter permease [Alphaproteobacteria bacterium]|nr:iron ABC transporter permease [Alphaproteobacteria bacterium]